MFILRSFQQFCLFLANDLIGRLVDNIIRSNHKNATAAKNLQEKLEDFTGPFGRQTGGGVDGAEIQHGVCGHSEAA